MENKPKFKPDPKFKLMNQMRQVLCYHHYAYRTKRTYCDQIVRYIKYHGDYTHPTQMDRYHYQSIFEPSAYLASLRCNSKAGPESHHFLYRDVFDQPIEYPLEPIKAKVKTIPSIPQASVVTRRPYSFLSALINRYIHCQEDSPRHHDKPVLSGLDRHLLSSCDLKQIVSFA